MHFLPTVIVSYSVKCNYFSTFERCEEMFKRRMKINVLVSMKSHLHAVTSFCLELQNLSSGREPSGWTTFDSVFCLLAAIFDQSNRAYPIDFLSASE